MPNNCLYILMRFIEVRKILLNPFGNGKDIFLCGFFNLDFYRILDIVIDLVRYILPLLFYRSDITQADDGSIGIATHDKAIQLIGEILSSPCTDQDLFIRRFDFATGDINVCSSHSGGDFIKGQQVTSKIRFRYFN